MADYPIPAETLRHEQVIKKSRFIAYLGHASTADAAHAFISQIAADYPDARHVCYAFIAGQPGNTTAVGCSDAGEPNGTAGKPMLNVLMHGGVGEIVAVVVRYFGGIKLGTGGLVRAYGGTVSEAMQMLETREHVALEQIALTMPYALEPSARKLIEDADGRIEAAEYTAELTLNCALPAQQIDGLLEQLNNQSGGALRVKRID
jgi:uncharacterized YigZ family protein